MSFIRARIDFGGNDVRAQGPGDGVLDQIVVTNITTVGNHTITAPQLTSGFINRTGPTGNYADIFPTADQLLLANPQFSIGDSFRLTKRNSVAFTDTPTAGEGCVLGANVNMAVSSVRQYLITVLGDGVRQAFNAVTTNASNLVTGLDPIAISVLRVGQGVTGTGIPANAFVTSINLNNRTFTLNANATATGAPALTSFPRYSVEGLFSATI